LIMGPQEGGRQPQRGISVVCNGGGGTCFSVKKEQTGRRERRRKRAREIEVEVDRRIDR